MLVADVEDADLFESVAGVVGGQVLAGDAAATVCHRVLVLETDGVMAEAQLELGRGRLDRFLERLFEQNRRSLSQLEQSNSFF